MLNRRVFLTAMGAAAVATATRAAEVRADQAIHEILRRRVDLEKRAVGMAACVVTPHGTRFTVTGYERSDELRRVTSRTVFEVGSITKVFTALLLADMARRGELRIDDPVARHLPAGFHLPALDGRAITLADLATHTAGLPRFPPFPGIPLSPAWIEAMARYSVEEFKAWLAGLQPSRQAGSAWEYSNAGYTLLGMALAHRAGRTFEELLQARVLDPVGLSDTALQPSATMQARLAQAHDAALRPLPPFDLGIFAAAGALHSTPHDLAHFASVILPPDGMRIALDDRLLLSVQRPAPAIGGAQALGWEILDAPGGSFVSKDGVTPGQAASMVFDPDTRVAVITFSNTQADLSHSTFSGGGVGAADIARHLLRPQIPLG